MGVIILGVFGLLAIGGAGWFSRFWTYIDRLGAQQKALVYLAAAFGAFFMMSFLYSMKFLGQLVNR